MQLVQQMYKHTRTYNVLWLKKEPHIASYEVDNAGFLASAVNLNGILLFLLLDLVSRVQQLSC